METVEQSIIDTKSTISQSVEDTGEKLTVIESSVAELRQVVSESSGIEYEGINMDADWSQALAEAQILDLGDLGVEGVQELETMLDWFCM